MTTCSNCGRDNADDAHFCSFCGARLETASRASERKLVTVLFADVTGSTELADRLDAEELRDVMSAWFAAVRAEIETQGGTVEKYIGDAVMAVFGAPTAHEDDPTRALRAALGMRSRLVELNEQLNESHGVTMEIRIGINTGEAVATLDPPPGEAIVTGLAVNAAARLEQLAEPGQTVVAERTARAAPTFRFDDLGPKQLRGTETPVRAFLLRGETAQANSRGLPGVHAPLVGRERELDLLTSVQERATAERRPHLVTIYGDPGVGKSRLVRELLRRLAAAPDPPRVLVGRCLSYGDGIAYWPLAEILKGLAGLSDDEPAGAALERIDELVADALESSATDVRALGSAALAFTLGLDADNAEFTKLQPSAIRAELHRVWRTLLSAVAERGPVVVVVDDIHWADPVLLDLLEEIAERAQGPLLFVCPARPALTDNRPTWGGGRRNFSSVFLGPLPAEAARELVASLLSVDGLPDEARARILDRAEGNPFFLEEILRQLIDQGRIVREAGRWKTTDDLLRLELPDTVQGVLAARIDLLDPSEKHTLQQASVVGRIFWRGAVAALIDDDEVVGPDLRRLEERELVATRLGSTMAGEEELAFSHILTRDVAYESLPRRDRPKAHARVATWIEATTGDRQREFVGLLAHHYLEAYRGASRDRSFPADELESLRQRAFDLLLEGSRNAVRGTAFAAARNLAESALEAAADATERAAALEALGDGLGHAGLGDEAWESYIQAATELERSGAGDDERIANLYALALERAARWTGTMAVVPDEAVAARHLDAALARLPAGESEGRVRLMTVQAFWGHPYPASESPYNNAERAERTGEEAAALALRIGRPDLAVVALDSVQHNLQRQLRYQEALAAAHRRLELARTAGDLNELGDSFAMCAWNALYLGSFAEARAIGREGYELLATDAPSYAVHSLSWSALAAYYLGDWDGLLADFEPVLAWLGERTLTSGFASPWPAAALVHEARGDRGASERLLEQAYLAERNRGAMSAHLTPEVVRTLLLRGELEAARDRLDAVYEPGRRLDNLPLVRYAEADILLAEERWGDLRAFAGSLRTLRTDTGAAYLQPVAERLLGHAERVDGNVDEAVRLLERSAAGFDALEMAVDAAIARLDAADVLAASGQLDEARMAVSLARGPLERAGHRPALARAARLEAR